MGCNTSNDRPKAVHDPIKGITEKNIPTASKVIDITPKAKSDMYDGIRNGMAIFCLDVFHSKYTGERMARWRAATIREFNPETLQVLIHFEGWKDKHDIILHFPDDIGRLAPADILNDQEKLEGQLLNESQYEATQIYLKTGLLQFEYPILEHEAILEPSPVYFPGQLIDVQDVYKAKNKPNVIYKWRPGEVKDVNGPHVLVHYVGWSEEWDEVIDTSVESRRLRPAGSQLPRRSPTKSTQLKDKNPENLAKKKSTQGEEVIHSNERRKSHSNVEEQRRGSFTNAASSSIGSNGSSGSRESDQNGTRVRHHKIAVQQSSLSRQTIPESELLIDNPHSHSDNARMSRKKFQRQQSNSAKQLDNETTSAQAHASPRRELNRNHSDPGAGFAPPPQAQAALAQAQEDGNDNDDDAIPPEIDESEYYETLKIETAFFKAMNHQGFHIVEMDGDGNCLFRSVAHQIYLDEDRHFELRLQCVQHLEKHADRFGSFYPGNFKEYLRNMKKPGVWGDDLEIKALEEMTDRLIHIYSSHSEVIEPLITNFDEREVMKDVQPILLSYHGKNHYNSVYDENTSLPLERRTSQTLLQLRCNSYRKK